MKIRENNETMKMKSAAGIVCYVKDVEETAQFYETLGFQLKTREPSRVTAYLNWFWIDFLSIDKEERQEMKEEATLGNKGAGLFLYLSVENVDDAYNELLEKGLKPSSEPQNRPGGIREFVLRDPDGYKLVFFKKK
jgi:catechol 2,3-dioxygenase-like lactoylglutathione lyase family enzyme